MKNLKLLIFFTIISYACHDESDITREILINQEGVAIFLADLTESTSGASQTSAIPALENLTLRPEPWIAPTDIAFYDFSTHFIHLREGITIDGDSLPNGGIFVVVANGERRYAGLFLPGYSSFMPLGSPVIRTHPKFYSDDVVHIDFIQHEDATEDPRNDAVIKEALRANDQFQAGISCTLTEVSGVTANGDLTYRYALRNLGSTPLYVLDPDKMGTTLFHYFTNGVALQNETDIYWAENHQVASPDPWNHWEERWFTLLKSNEAINRTVTLDGFPVIPKGVYECSFRFPSVNHIERGHRKLEGGRIWLGEVSDTRVFELN